MTQGSKMWYFSVGLAVASDFEFHTVSRLTAVSSQVAPAKSCAPRPCIIGQETDSSERVPCGLAIDQSEVSLQNQKMQQASDVQITQDKWSATLVVSVPPELQISDKDSLRSHFQLRKKGVQNGVGNAKLPTLLHRGTALSICRRAMALQPLTCSQSTYIDEL